MRTTPAWATPSTRPSYPRAPPMGPPCPGPVASSSQETSLGFLTELKIRGLLTACAPLCPLGPSTGEGQTGAEEAFADCILVQGRELRGLESALTCPGPQSPLCRPRQGRAGHARS